MSKAKQFMQETLNPSIEHASSGNVLLDVISVESSFVDEDREIGDVISLSESLESLQDSLEKMAQSGETVSDETLKFLSVAFEEILDKEGLELRDLGIESLAEKDSDLTVSAERIKDKLETFAEFFSGGFDGKAKKRIKVLTDAIADVDRSTQDALKAVKNNSDLIEEKKIQIIDFNFFSSIFVRSGKPVENMVTELKSDAKTIEEYATLLSRDAVNYFKEIEKALSASISSDEDADKVLSTLSGVKNPFSVNKITYGPSALLNNTAIVKDEEKPIKFQRDMGSLAHRVVYRTYVSPDGFGDDVNALLSLFAANLVRVYNAYQQSGYINAKSLEDIGRAMSSMIDSGKKMTKAMGELVILHESIVLKNKALRKSIPKSVSKANRKDLKKLSFLNGHLKAVVRHPASGLFRHIVIFSDKFDKIQRRLVGKIEKNR